MGQTHEPKGADHGSQYHWHLELGGLFLAKHHLLHHANVGFDFMDSGVLT